MRVPSTATGYTLRCWSVSDHTAPPAHAGARHIGGPLARAPDPEETPWNSCQTLHAGAGGRRSHARSRRPRNQLAASRCTPGGCGVIVTVSRTGRVPSMRTAPLAVVGCSTSPRWSTGTRRTAPAWVAVPGRTQPRTILTTGVHRLCNARSVVNTYPGRNTILSVITIEPAQSEVPPVSSVCAQGACSFCRLNSETCGCSNCHLTCSHCLGEARRLYAGSSCRACHTAITKHRQPAGTACTVCHSTTEITFIDPRISADPLCSSDHLRYWVIHT